MAATDQWTDRIEIKSESSSRVYIVARRVSTGLWECSCPGRLPACGQAST
jgi:hypothetical protein